MVFACGIRHTKLVPLDYLIHDSGGWNHVSVVYFPRVHPKGPPWKKIKFLQLAPYHMVEEMAPLWSSGYLDRGWENGIAQDERKMKVKCNYCRKMISGGKFRLKQHLVRLTGEVTHCEKVLEDVCLSMRKNLEGCHSVRK